MRVHGMEFICVTITTRDQKWSALHHKDDRASRKLCHSHRKGGMPAIKKFRLLHNNHDKAVVDSRRKTLYQTEREIENSRWSGFEKI